MSSAVTDGYDEFTEEFIGIVRGRTATSSRGIGAPPAPEPPKRPRTPDTPSRRSVPKKPNPRKPRPGR